MTEMMIMVQTLGDQIAGLLKSRLQAFVSRVNLVREVGCLLISGSRERAVRNGQVDVGGGAQTISS